MITVNLQSAAAKRTAWKGRGAVMIGLLFRELNMRRLRCLNMQLIGVLAVFVMMSPALADNALVKTTLGKTTLPYLPVPHGAAVILNSGSTNAGGYRIVVAPNGSAEFATAYGRGEGRVPDDLSRQFFTDLRSAAPLHALSHIPCMKSISFGSAVLVYWNHSRSPDISCPTNAAGQALLKDALAIAAALQVSPSRPVMRPLAPGEHRLALPTPSPSP